MGAAEECSATTCIHRWGCADDTGGHRGESSHYVHAVDVQVTLAKDAEFSLT